MPSKSLDVPIDEIFVELYTYAYFWLAHRTSVEGTVTLLFKELYHICNQDNNEFRHRAIRHLVNMSVQEDSLYCDKESDDDYIRWKVKKLPIKYKVPLLMQIKGGFCHTDIAHILEISHAEVDERLFIGKLIIRNGTTAHRL